MKINKKMIILICFVAIIAAGIGYVQTFKLTDITIEGCENVDEKAVLETINEYNKSGNTLLFLLKLKFKPIPDIPFVQKLDVEYVSKNEIKVTVYEKVLAGCVEYMDGYVYFDKDGKVLDSSNLKFPGVPIIKGLTFNEWEYGKQLPIDDPSKFNYILTITQLRDKYDLSIQTVEFTEENEIVLTHDKITILLGEGEYLAIQMMNLGSILDGLEGMEGTLYMKDFDSENAEASFHRKPSQPTVIPSNDSTDDNIVE